MIAFDGHDFESLFIVGDPSLSFAVPKPTLDDAEGRDGQVVRGMRFGSGAVSFRLGFRGTPDERRIALSTLAGWLDVDEPKYLVLPETGWRYKAIPDGAVETTRGIGGDIHKVKFAIVEPAAYGLERSVTVPSGGSAGILVNGTYPTRPTITAQSAVRDSTTQVWGIRMEDGTFVHVPTGSASARSVSVDCESRVAKVANAAAMPTLDSDWLVLTPGDHTITNDQGTGASTFSWFERWL